MLDSGAKLGKYVHFESMTFHISARKSKTLQGIYRCYKLSLSSAVRVGACARALCLRHKIVFFVRFTGALPASPDQGHDRLCRRGVGKGFLAGVRPDSPSRRRIPSCYRPGPGRGVVVELGQRGAH